MQPLFKDLYRNSSRKSTPKRIRLGIQEPQSEQKSALDAQWEALDTLADVCRELHAAHDFEPGEMQILNNHVVYHARDPYEDHEDLDRKRLLYRLWICPPVNRALPHGHEVLWRNIEANTVRGGIRSDT